MLRLVRMGCKCGTQLDRVSLPAGRCILCGQSPSKLATDLVVDWQVRDAGVVLSHVSEHPAGHLRRRDWRRTGHRLIDAAVGGGPMRPMVGPAACRTQGTVRGGPSCSLVYATAEARQTSLAWWGCSSLEIDRSSRCMLEGGVRQQRQSLGGRTLAACCAAASFAATPSRELALHSQRLWSATCSMDSVWDARALHKVSKGSDMTVGRMPCLCTHDM